MDPSRPTTTDCPKWATDMYVGVRDANASPSALADAATRLPLLPLLSLPRRLCSFLCSVLGEIASPLTPPCIEEEDDGEDEVEEDEEDEEEEEEEEEDVVTAHPYFCRVGDMASRGSVYARTLSTLARNDALSGACEKEEKEEEKKKK